MSAGQFPCATGHQWWELFLIGTLSRMLPFPLDSIPTKQERWKGNIIGGPKDLRKVIIEKQEIVDPLNIFFLCVFEIGDYYWRIYI